LKLSVLDLSPVTGGATQAQAVRETIEVAKAAEALGYPFAEPMSVLKAN